jgi:hypothetical protein
LKEKLYWNMKNKNKKGVEDGLADAFCCLVFDGGLSVADVRSLDIASFFILFEFFVARKEAERKESQNIKGKGKGSGKTIGRR